MIVVGAGLAGLIAASMLHDEVDVILEAQKEIPNNHSALLRFKSSVVGDAIGIPFQEVKVQKSVQRWRNAVADNISYSMKCIGQVQLRSLTTAEGEIETRYIAPENLIQRLGDRLKNKIRLGEAYEPGHVNIPEGEVIISTMPMVLMMKMLGWKNIPEFKYTGGTVITCDLPPSTFNICATVYMPSPEEHPYRASITGNKLIIECSDANGEVNGANADDAIMQALAALGLDWCFEFVLANHKLKRMTYAKITPISEEIRRRFILWASEHHNIYSLGRFATWRPGLLLDDLIKDVRTIQKLIHTGDTYSHRLKG